MGRSKLGICMFWNVLGMLGLSGNILADTFFVADRLGADGLAALNLAVSVFGLINGTGMMLGIGGSTRWAISAAAGREREGRGAFLLASAMGAGAGLFLAAAGTFGAEWLAGVLGAEGEILPLCASYLKIILQFSPLFICNHVFIAFMRGSGSPGMAMGGMMAASLTNIVLDYLFMYPLGWGIRGAAFATALAPAAGLAVAAVWLAGNRAFFSPKGAGAFSISSFWPAAGDLIRLGGAAFVNESSTAAVMAVFNLLILEKAGSVGVAAYGIVANLALVTAAVFTGISQGCQPLIASAHGRGRGEEGADIYRKAGRLAGALGLTAVLAAWWFAPVLTALFNGAGDPVLQQTAETGLRLYFIGFLFVGWNLMTAAFLGAVERTGPAFRFSVFRGFLGIVGAALVLSQMMGLAGVWLAFPAAELAARILGRRFMPLPGDTVFQISGTDGGV